MPTYDLRLYKEESFQSTAGIFVESKIFEAPNDPAAIDMARNSKIFPFDNSDFYIVYKGKQMIYTEHL